MAFICTVRGDTLDTIRTLSNGNETVVIAHIGYDCTDDVNYWLQVGLSPNPCGQEYFFNINVTHGDHRPDYRLWESLEVSKIVEQQDRKKVKLLLFHLSSMLLDHVTPEHFTMTTIEADLPQRVIGKFIELTHLFVRHRYHIIRYVEFRGQHLWRMERAT